MPLLSIVIPNYNYGRFADRFFQSIARQSMPLNDVEIFFIDDGSSDDSIENAQKWATKLTCKRFEVESLPRIGRPGPVRNFGLERSTGKYLLSLDPDDTLHPEYLSTCITTLEENQNVDLVYTNYQENRTDSSRDVELPRFNQAHLRTQNALSPTAMYRREIWDSGVRYRDNTDYEDWDYWIQCQMTGAKFLHIPHSLYFYEIHGMNFTQQAIRNDGHAKAQIVMNNPSFFHPQVCEWAKGFMRHRLHAQAFRRGYIPSPQDIRELLQVIEQKALKR